MLYKTPSKLALSLKTEYLSRVLVSTYAPKRTCSQIFLFLGSRVCDESVSQSGSYLIYINKRRIAYTQLKARSKKEINLQTIQIFVLMGLPLDK